jgi:hypothetical protein
MNSDNSQFDEAWRAYVEEDAEVHAPEGLEARVWNAIAVPSSRPAWRPRTRFVFVGASIAAAIAIAVFVALRKEPDRRQVTQHEPAAVRTPLVNPEPAAPVATVAPATAAPSRARAPRRPREVLPPVLMNLGASPVRDTEVLQLVRLRLPREALQTLGVVLLEPDAAAMVDVDVLIGEDGVARDIRQVRAGQEQETPQW